MVNQEKVKELLLQLNEEIQQVSNESDFQDAMDALEILKEILQMN